MAKVSTPKKWEDAVLLPLDALVFCPWNVNEMADSEFSELVAEIEEHGFDEPLQVICLTDAHQDTDSYPLLSPATVVGKYLVLGGEHRARAARALDWKEAPCVVKDNLAAAPEDDLVVWSTKRNNIRGRINAQKYADVERSLAERHKVRLEVARRRMLVQGDLLKRLRKNIAVQDNEGATSGGNAGAAQAPSSNHTGTSAGAGKPITDGEADRKKEIRDRHNLFQALKAAETDVLLQSGDTVDHGYLFFAQGGLTHLVVNESDRLIGLVKRMIAACKKDSARVDDFLCDAINAELPQWEDK
jgi:hypothetical protein